MVDGHSAASPADVPPIVLFVEDDADTLDMYSTYFEMSGMWVARAKTVQDALTGVAELHPNLVVTDLTLDGASGGELIHTLRSRTETHDIPLILLSGQDPERIPVETRQEADLCLVKPVLPDALLEKVECLLAKSADLRRRSTEALAQTQALVRLSRRLRDQGRVARALWTGASRPCPHCGAALEWVERGCIAGTEYDYYRWCEGGCGLFCFDRVANRWVKLV